MLDLKKQKEQARANIAMLEIDLKNIEHLQKIEHTKTRYENKLININSDTTMPLYDFIILLYKSLTKKYKKESKDTFRNIEDSIRSIDDNGFFKMGSNLFGIGNCTSVYNIDRLLQTKPKLPFLHNDDIEVFYRKLETALELWSDANV